MIKNSDARFSLFNLFFFKMSVKQKFAKYNKY